MNHNTNADNLVSVLLPALSDTQTARKCLDALVGQHYEPFEIIVLAGSSYTSPHQSDKRVRIARVSATGGMGRMGLLAEGLKRIKGGTAVWVDPRYIPAGGDWLQHLVEPFKECSVGAVTGRNRFSSGSGRHFGGLLDFAVDSFPAHCGKRRKEVPVISLKCDAFRTELLKKILSTVDPAPPRPAEPVELSMRIRQEGYRIIYQPGVQSVAGSVPDASLRPAPGDTLIGALRFGEADAFLGRRWGIDWLHGRIYMAAILSLFLIPLALISVPYATIAAGLLFGWGWFFGFHIPFLPWEWPVALVNLGVFIAVILAVRDDWAPWLFPPRRTHPAIIRQWLFVFSMPISYILITLAAGFRTALGGISGISKIHYLPPLALVSALWHVLSGIGYAGETFRPKYKKKQGKKNSKE